MIETVVSVVLVCGGFGAFGGLAAHFINFADQTPDEKGRLGTGSGVMGIGIGPWKSMYVGAAGAIGFLFFMLAVGGLVAQFNALPDILRTISTSTIAGFGARRLLPRMVDHLEQQVANAAERAEEATELADTAVKELRKAELQSELLQVNINLKEAANKTASAVLRRSAVEEAERIIQKGNATSSTWVALARVHRASGELERAIATLNLVQKAIEKGEVDNKNLAALFYNRACYRVLLYDDKTSAVEKRKAFEDLQSFFEQTEDPKYEANIIKEDSDWVSVVDDPGFNEIVDKWLSA